LMDLLNNVDSMNQTSTLGAQDAAQKSTENAAKDHSSDSPPSSGSGGKITSKP
jgi:hypothetical protein